VKLGIIISVNDAETCWNALRFASFSLAQKDEVKVFLVGKGVEYQSVGGGIFDTVGQGEAFLRAGGKMYACGTCMESRNQPGNAACPMSTMKDMYEIVRDSDRVVTF
jgi:uncharacterized protein involved in oxidation of intracellular sulfur